MIRPVVAALVLPLALACPSGADGDRDEGEDAGEGEGEGEGDGATCALLDDTTATDVLSASGCAVRARDTTTCRDARVAQGLDGAWLRYSCRVALTVDGDVVEVVTDDLPDHTSNYFAADDPCHEAFPDGVQNPNLIAPQDFTLRIPRTPDTTATQMRGQPVVGAAVDGVVVFGNFAAPGDDIYQEARTFDRCGAHPQQTGIYHYHSEPLAISDDDAHFIGMMLDGYPIYGQRDVDDGVPDDLDEFGGHTGPTADADGDVYHYHVNPQVSTNPGSEGERQLFLTTGRFRGTPGDCVGASCALPPPP